MHYYTISPMATPRCPYFGKCGGCAYQDLEYESELSLKENQLKELFQKELGLSEEVFLPIVPSPTPYFYRSRLDLSFHRHRDETVLGFMEEGTHRFVSIDSCAIARPEINTFLPALKRLAQQRLPENYRSANLVIKTDQEGKIRWGGIGRRSLELYESDYLWIQIEGKRIFYSLDSFFQANLGILSRFMKSLRSLLSLTPETCLLDLYAGVGLFGVVFADEVREVWAVEENKDAIRLAEFNRRYHNLSRFFIMQGKIEDLLEEVLRNLEGRPQVAVVDPPRGGLTPRALEELAKAETLSPLIYVSCNPETLVRDLKTFIGIPPKEPDGSASSSGRGWKIDRVEPFDFFPRTRHLEVVTRLVYHRPV